MLRLLRGASSALRRFSTEVQLEAEGKHDNLAKWLQEWVAVPKVVVQEGMEPPTALSFLRRRGPPLPEAALHKLFRQETVRVYDPASQKVSRASKCKPLAPGSLLLLPKSAVAAATAAAGGGDGGSAAGGASSAGRRQQRALSPAQQRAQGEWVGLLRQSLLHQGPDFLAINKPGGLATQGGQGVAFSVDSLMGEAFGQVQGVHASQLRLVHRLDRQTTGVLLLAKDPDAAAWLAAAFRDSSGTSSGGSGGGSGRSSASSSAHSSSSAKSSSSSAGRRSPARATPSAAPAPAGGAIHKTYWAVVVRGDGDTSATVTAASSSSRTRSSSARRSGKDIRRDSRGGWLPPAGVIDLPVPSSKDASQLQPAHTRFRVLQQSGQLAWVELQPGTGRKHQLRLHCAQGLGAAVMGDGRYGELRSAVQQKALAVAAAAAGRGAAEGTAAAASRLGSSSGPWPPLFLHCRSLEVRRPGGGGKGRSVTVAAPLPDTWCALLRQLGWPLPGDG